MSDHAQQLADQAGRFCSSELARPDWHPGMRAAFDWFFPASLRGLAVADIACGDGIQLAWLVTAGAMARGVELVAAKAERARASGATVWCGDLHRLPYRDATLDVVYSSHTLEHAYDPPAALAELRRVLRPGGRLCLVLPFPDVGPDAAHGGKYALGTTADDDGVVLRAVVAGAGFACLRQARDARREPEIWLDLVRDEGAHP